MGQSRKRERFLFWLYPDTDREITKIISHFKGLKEYSFVQAIRDGLRLVADLREGRVDVLLELFPWIEERLSPGRGLAPKIEFQLEEIVRKLDERPLPVGNPIVQKGDLDFDFDIDLAFETDSDGGSTTQQMAGLLNF